MINARKFWMIWSPTGRQPTFRHSSRKAANAEAERLAIANPGSAFFVLKAVGGAYTRVPDPLPPSQIVFVERGTESPAEDDIPF